MRSTVKTSMGLIVTLLMVLVMFAGTTVAFADDSNLEYKVVSNLKVNKNWMGIKTGISGTVNLDKTINATTAKPVEGTTNVYKGSISSSVEAADLFEGSYRLYEKEFKGKKDVFKRAWENIVMFN